MADKPDNNVRPLSGEELDAVLDLVAQRGAVVMTNVNAGKSPETHSEGEAWGYCATSAPFLAATLNQMLRGNPEPAPSRDGTIKNLRLEIKRLKADLKAAPGKERERIARLLDDDPDHHGDSARFADWIRGQKQ